MRNYVFRDTWPYILIEQFMDILIMKVLKNGLNGVYNNYYDDNIIVMQYLRYN